METKLIERKEVAEGTMSFRFEKPSDFTYTAGQSIDLFLINPSQTDAEGNKRAFTLSSSPDDRYLQITTRMRDTAFKRELKSAPEGMPVRIEGPFGDLTLPERTDRKIIFLAGGIGITPFFAMAQYAALHQLPHQIVLFYSNRSAQHAAFLTELQTLAGQNPNFTLVATMTDTDSSSETWSGEHGYIDAHLLSKHNAFDTNPIFYLAGPNTMATAMRTMLNESGISNDDIRTEEFSGY